MPVLAESRPDVGDAAVRVRVIWADDRTPAVGVSVRIVEWAGRSGVWKTRTKATGSDGSLQLTDLLPGKVVFFIDRARGASFNLASGKNEEVTLEIPVGMTVAGVVAAADGSPVAGADIWLSQYGNASEGAVITRSDMKGEFSLRGVGPGHWIAARAPGHAATGAVRIPDGKPGDTVRVPLRFEGPGGSVRGIVLRPNGLPLAGARLRISGIYVESDESGRFIVEGLPLREVRIAVRYPGLAPWTGSVAVKAGDPTPVEIRVQREAVVFGTVSLTSGLAAAGASISSGNDYFLLSSTQAAEDGSFRLGSLMPGRVDVVAFIPEVGKAATTLDCAEGAEVRWDPVIDAGLSIGGVVRDDQDQPLAGWVVNARSDTPSASGWRGSSATDGEGRFRIVNCPADTRLRIEVIDRQAPPGTGVRAALPDVAPGQTDLVIRVSAKSLATVKGRVVGHDGSIPAASIRLDPPREAETITVVANTETGRFSIGPLLPDRWRIIVERKPLGALDLGERHLGSGETLELGDIVLPPMGTLTVDLASSDVCPEQAICEIRQVMPPRDGRPSSWSGLVSAPYREFPRPLELGPGTYRVVLSAPGTTSEPEQLQIESGQETRWKPGPTSRPSPR